MQYEDDAMRVLRSPISAGERTDFEATIRASGRDPDAFTAELFFACECASGCVFRCVHVSGGRAAAQYEASGEPAWTEKFARHLARGVFG